MNACHPPDSVERVRTAHVVFIFSGATGIQFGGQEPENDEKIAEFCELNHGVTFPLMTKSDVNGDNTNEVFKWLKSEKAGLLGLTRIKVRPELPVSPRRRVWCFAHKRCAVEL